MRLLTAVLLLVAGVLIFACRNPVEPRQPGQCYTMPDGSVACE